MYIIGIIIILSLILGLFVVAPLWIYFIAKNINNKLNNLENIKTQIEINQEKLIQKITELSNNKILSPQDKTLLQTEINSIQNELNQQQTDLLQIQFSLGKLKLKNFKKLIPKKL
ncbi:MAG: OmpH family outer membrane protein [Candidatus Phytoplasma sp. TWB_XP]